MSVNDDTTGKLPTGLEGTDIPDDFFIPEAGLEDVDRAVFELFDKKLKFLIEQKGETNKVPVIFASGERYAMVKNKRPFRDVNGTLIIPLISVYRTGLTQDPQQQGFGPPGALRNTGDLVIKKRLSSKDREYQNLINKIDLRNQDNVASPENYQDGAKPQTTTLGKVSTRRKIGKNRSSLIKGDILDNKLDDNIVEVITIPFPEYFLATYEITFWTNYITHMNRMIEILTTSYDGQGNQFKLNGKAGYWYVGFVDNDFKLEDNFDDFADTERLIRVSFNVNVPGYIVATQHEGQENPFRRYYSAPNIEFSIKEVQADVQTPLPQGAGSTDPNKFILTDLDELDKDGNLTRERNHSPDKVLTKFKDPFTGEETTRYLRIVTTNQRKGETVASARVPIDEYELFALDSD